MLHRKKKNSVRNLAEYRVKVAAHSHVCPGCGETYACQFTGGKACVHLEYLGCGCPFQNRWFAEHVGGPALDAIRKTKTAGGINGIE